MPLGKRYEYSMESKNESLNRDATIVEGFFFSFILEKNPVALKF